MRSERGTSFVIWVYQISLRAVWGLGRVNSLRHNLFNITAMETKIKGLPCARDAEQFSGFECIKNRWDGYGIWNFFFPATVYYLMSPRYNVIQCNFAISKLQCNFAILKLQCNFAISKLQCNFANFKLHHTVLAILIYLSRGTSSKNPDSK